jgi:hypothetical protein
MPINQQQQGGGGWNLGGGLGYQFMPTPNAWTPSPFAQQTPYAQSMIAPARINAAAAENVAQINAGAQNWNTSLDFLGDIQQSPWGLAQTSQATLPAAQASMYGSYAGGLADILGSYYPSAAQISTAHLDPWAQSYQAGLGANLQRDLAQMQNEAQFARQQSMFGFASPLLEALTRQSQSPLVSLQTDYGAGIS